MIGADVTAVILAGGRATRLGGVAKHALVVGGATILDRQRAVLAPRVAEIVLAGPEVPGLRSVRDPVPGVGPLGGIAAALEATRTAWLLVVAGDMPEVCGALVDLLLARRTGHDAAGLVVGGLPEPLLCALAVATARVAVAAMLAAGDHKASHLLTDAGLRVAWITEDEARAVDPDLRGLRNVNTPADLDSPPRGRIR